MPEKTDKDKMDQILKIDPPVELVFRGKLCDVPCSNGRAWYGNVIVSRNVFLPDK